MGDLTELLQDALNVLELYKGTVPPDKFKNDVLPLMYKIRNELAVIRIDAIKSKQKQKLVDEIKKKNLPDFVDTPTLPEFMDTPTVNLENDMPTFAKTRPCKTDPRAPHGYLEELSKTMDRYVCKCEFWSADIFDK